MKANQEISQLISSYLDKSISEEGFNTLDTCIKQSPENKKLFEEYLRVYKTSRNIELIENLDENVAWNQIMRKIKRPLNQKKSNQISKVKLLTLNNPFFKYAAITVLFLGTVYFFSKNYFFSSSNGPAVPPGSIVLQMSDGNVKILNEGGNDELLDDKGNIIGSHKGEHLTYSNDQVKEKLVYNTLKIPYGKRFSVKLSDGTTVILNSGTSLKYPVKFIKGEKRRVFLNGEAHFDVTRDTLHPFIVDSENMKIQVLGTTFNVSAYPEDASSDVVLIEGSVEMSANTKSSKQSVTLIPGAKGTLSKTSSSISTEKVDTSIYTSWVHGELFFRNMPFQNIVKKLERRYDRKIVIQNKQLNDEIFNASFKDEPIENVLSYFKDSFNIEYETKDHVIYIN